MLSVNRKCEQSVTTDQRRTFTKVLGADKEKVHRDQTLGNTGGNNNKDAMFDWRSGCQSTLGSRGYFFLIDISRRSCVNEAQSAEEKKITSGHRSTQPHFHARSQFRN